MKVRSATLVLALLGAASCGAPPPPVAAPAGSASARATASAKPPTSGAPAASVAPALQYTGPLTSGPHGETAGLANGAVVIERPGKPRQTLAPDDLHAAPGDRSLHGIWPRELLFLDDGTLLVGAEDGTLTAVDLDGKRRWTLGLRGAIRGMARATADLAVVTTDRGVMALVTGAGKARWERQITAERLGPPVVMSAAGGEPRAFLTNSQRGVFALSPEGKDLFSHAAPFVHHDCSRGSNSYSTWLPPPNADTCTDPPADGRTWVELPPLTVDGDAIQAGPALRFKMDSPHPPVPSLAHVFPLTFTRVLEGDVVSILPDGPSAVLALVCHAGRDYGYYTARLVAQLHHECKIVRVSGAVTAIATVPEEAATAAIILKGERPPNAPPDLVIDGMIRGPEGKPWILARKISPYTFGGEDGSSSPPGGAGLILGLDGGKVAERKDLLEDFSGEVTWFPLVGASEGAAGLICAGSQCGVRKQASFQAVDPDGSGIVDSVALVGGRPWLTQGGEVRRAKGKGFVAVAGPKNAYFAAVAGVSEADVWGDAAQRNGLLHWDGSRWSEVPTPPATGALFARASDDVWSGRLRWDGKRWSLVDGAPDATAVLARGRDDVWMGSPAGLWHGVGPGPQPTSLAAPPPDEGLPASAPLALGDPESRFVAARIDAAVAKAARPPEPERSWALVDGPVPSSRDEREKGLTLWEDTGPHARVRDAGVWRPVLSLPSAAWVAVAEAADGGAWFAGGLGPGPSGEGILFHAAGPLGASASLRVRAPASLLAVAAVGPSEAWAVGAAGAVVHVRDGAVTRQSLPSGEWLRAVLVAADGVWMAGDEGTLLHHDGASFRPVPQPLGGHAAFTSLVASGGAVWAFGPSGALKITKRP